MAGRVTPPFAETLKRLLALHVGSDDTEDEISANAVAVATALRLVWYCYGTLESRFPEGRATVTEDGGVQIYWDAERRKVHLLISGDDEPRVTLYHASSAHDYGLERTVTGAALSRWLAWLTP